MQPSNLTLAFYFDMLFVNSIAKIQSTFIGNKILIQKGYSYLQEYDYYINDELVIDDGKNSKFITDIITKEDFLENLLDFETVALYKKIENEVSIRSSAEEKSEYLNSIYTDIQTLLRRVLKNEDDKAFLVEDKLLEMVENLKDRYSPFIQYHAVFNYLVRDADTSFFRNKDLKYSFYVELYEVAYNLYLIDDSETEEVDFINAFTVANPQILENKIRFIAKNPVMAYFLVSLRPFFHGFTYSAIGKSGIFLNKQSKAIKSGDISAALNRGKINIQDEMNKIDTHILKLIERHLK